MAKRRRSSSNRAIRLPWTRLTAGLGGVLVIGLVGSALFGENGVIRHERLSTELERIRTINDGLRTENRRLRIETEGLRSNPAYMEAVIRDEIGWVRPDDLIVFLPSQEESQ